MKTASYGAALLLVLSSSNTNAQQSSVACQSALSGAYLDGVTTNPNLKDQIELVAKYQIAQWYTDRVADVATLAKTVGLPKCDIEGTSPPTVIVYGLPQKDCAGGFSTAGSNANTDNYRDFLQHLADATGDREVVYILEPDAIGLLANGGCGIDKGYAANLGVAMTTLSQNVNAEMYLDVGYWTLSNNEQAAAVAKIVNAVDTNFQCKGIALNIANYRSKVEMIATCERFVKASGRNYKCIVDTSRNYVTVSTEWCNSKWAGMGDFPTNNTGSDVISRFIWAKPAGESDGECTGQSNEALRGPKAGNFFPDSFVNLWDNGIFVQKLGMAPIDSAAITTNNVTTTPLDAPVQSPVPTSSATTDSNAALNVSSPLTQVPQLVQVEPPRIAVVVDVVPENKHNTVHSASDFTSIGNASTVSSDPKACT